MRDRVLRSSVRPLPGPVRALLNRVSPLLKPSRAPRAARLPALAIGLACTVGLAGVAGLTACSAPGQPAVPVDAQLSDEDRATLEALAPIAVRDAELSGLEGPSTETPSTDEPGVANPGEVECWAPSAHQLETGGFRVICRVHYELAGAERYRDVICIGDAQREPVAESCYRWAPYSAMPAFEDHPAFSAGV